MIKRLRNIGDWKVSNRTESDSSRENPKFPRKHNFSLALLLGLAIAVAALLFLAWLTEEVLEGDTKSFDDSTRLLIHQYASPGLTSLMRVVTLLGSVSFLLVANGVFALLLILTKQWRALALLVITMAGALLLNGVLKVSFHRARPEAFFDYPLPHSYSFPSGHALLSLCFYGVVSDIAASRTRSRAIRLSIWIVAVVVILLIGLSRIYLGVHYPSDVLAGYAAAIIWIVSVKNAEHFFPHIKDIDEHQRNF